MKDTDKVTLTIAQLKKLVKESKQINEAKSFREISLSDLTKSQKFYDKLKEALEIVSGSCTDLYDVLESAPKELDKEWTSELNRKYNEFIKDNDKVANLLDVKKLPFL